ncbi:unnamed protein product [Tilletia controversa]|uniref:serine--tRNA ligase n=3 Tax=Tilletia TaxID=13289 RepID=A0A8X7MT92_9BASI|nr:hypothetical protein CF336_g4196 [Tilletia laevis]KAE8197345.1 hypothetical protein CF328_g3877 [Tilletia controversa]KAE8261155.1 hypothetical protein A4X03_0g3495 [Tilletia caries]KAE8247278.1 hypothetical protein A4X06_0g4568 [Tilletia controversa]CAD6887365.1 unnamed protein product [Tilletia caries]
MLSVRNSLRCAACHRRALSSSSTASASAPSPPKALGKARSLPETPSAPFSLQPAVVDAAFANAKRRNFPVREQQWRTTLERTRAELPGLADEVAQLKKALSRDPRNHKKKADEGAATAAATETSSTAPSDPAALKQRLRALTTQHDALLQSSLDVRLRFPNGTHADVPLGPEPNARLIGYGDPLGLLPSEVTAAFLDKIPCAVHELPAVASGPSKPDPKRAHTEVAAQLQHSLFPLSSALDQASGALTTGASFPFLLGPLAALSHALSTYALRICAEHGFLLVRAPDVIRADLARRCGFMPRDEGEASQTYFVTTQRASAAPGSDADTTPELCLAGTAEIPLAGLCADRTFFLPPSHSSTSTAAGSGPFLPLKICALGSAFRAEAGARGADTKGLYRVHQFDKVEMFVVAPMKEARVDAETEVAQGQGQTTATSAVSPFAAEDADMTYLDELRVIQEEIISGLGLPYRVLDMPTEELGASACRKYDIEAWMPGRGSWGEISSASHCTTFQSRRLNIRYRRSPGSQGKLEYAHTLNATAAAMPRLIVAILENFGLGDGPVPSGDGNGNGRGSEVRLRLPEVLRPYWIEADTEVEWVSVGEGSAEDELQSSR